MNKPSSYYSYNSLWNDQLFKPDYPQLKGELEVDVVVVGGGIAGLTVAYLLKQAGKTVAVLEKSKIANGTTAGTTGKVTSQHGQVYSQLAQKFGIKSARLYGQHNENAITNIESMISKEKIDCQWTRVDNYIYTCKPSEVQAYRDEASMATKLGLPASFEKTSELPYDVTGQVKFANQARFNAAAYVVGLARVVDGSGSYIFEHSEVKHVRDGTSCTVSTKQGTINGQHVIIASKIPPAPLLARFTYALYEYPTTSYIVASKYAGGLKDMHISTDAGLPSILPVEHNGKKYMFVGGQSHIPGLGNADKRLSKLEEMSQKYFSTDKAEFKWKAMDYIAYDDLPLVGKLQPWSKNIYVMTGFKKWGLTTSYVSSEILRDTIFGIVHELSTLYYPHRLSTIKSLPRTAYTMAKKKFSS
jgi:glycine/D-amino acid oxidase-like deaminating enzyme